MKNRSNQTIEAMRFISLHANKDIKGAYLTTEQVLLTAVLLGYCITNEHKKMGILSLLDSQYSMFIMICHCQIRDTLRMVISDSFLFFPLIVLFLAIAAGFIVDRIKAVRMQSGQ